MTRSIQKSLSCDGVLVSKLFGRWPWALHGITSRKTQTNGAGLFSNLQQIHHIKNLQSLNVVSAEQLHTNKVRFVCELTLQKSKSDGAIIEIPGVDAIITNCRNTLLTIRTADCVPIQFVDPYERIIGLAHAGWKGTLGRITQNVIREFTRLGSREKNIYIYIGPSICMDHYEVGVERIALFKRHFPESYQGFVHKRNLDLAKCNIIQARDLYIPAENIINSQICTCCEIETFYSFRGDGFKVKDYNISYLMIK